MRFTAPKLGDVLAKKFRIAEARTTKNAWERKLEETARQLGADLTDPAQFRTVDDLVRGR